MNNLELDPTLEVIHLRRLLDIQPGCLMRLGADGVVLAANDAALTLLGMTSHAQALGRDFAAWIPPDQQDRWKAFTLQVIRGAPASVECDVAAPNGDRQAVLFHGVSLIGHPDGVASMAVAARAVSGQRNLEAAVVEREELLRESDAEQLQARERLAEADANRRQLEENVHSLAEAVAARGAAEAACDHALSECRRLETALEAFAARHAEMTTERAAERRRVLQLLDAIAVKHREELAAMAVPSVEMRGRHEG